MLVVLSSCKPKSELNSINHQPLVVDFPAKPSLKPLPWPRMADEFNAFVLDTVNKAMYARQDGCYYFPADLQGTSDELITYGPVVLGKILRGDDVGWLLPSLAGYFNQDAGIFLNGTSGNSIEYWYLLNVDALAAGIIRTKLSDDAVSIKMLRSTADRLMDMAHQIEYDFNDQGYNFESNTPWTRKDIYRQPDVVGAYAYLMLFAYEMFGDSKYLEESKIALLSYQDFEKNPWYEIPSGAMSCITAARLGAHYRDPDVDLHKVLSFALDPHYGAMQAGDWGGREVNGLIRGWGGADRGEAYSMESMVLLPYLLPVLRYNTQYAEEIGKYALNLSANMRWFYSDHMPSEQQSRPDLTPVMPYEKLTRTKKGYTPYAGGDFGSQRSIYGGAYVLWFGEIIRPTQDDYILQINVSKTDFLAEASYPTYLYYNPWPEERKIVLQLDSGAFDIYETIEHQRLHRAARGSVTLKIPGGGARVVVVVPSDKESTIENGILKAGGVPVDYQVKP